MLIKKALKIIVFFVLYVPNFCFGLSTGADVQTSKYPFFKPLKEGNIALKGEMHVNGKVKKLDKVSFSGDIKVGISDTFGDKWVIKGVNDKSTNVLDLTKISEISIINRNYSDEQNAIGDYFLAKVVFDDGSISHLLVPYKLVICGNKSSGMGKAWYLRDIDKLVLTKEKFSK